MYTESVSCQLVRYKSPNLNEANGLRRPPEAARHLKSTSTLNDSKSAR